MEQLKNKPLYEQLYELQEEYNRHTNITRINNKEDYYNKHIFDSLSLVKLLSQNSTLIDIGSGAGYPGIPLAIERPDIKVTLNDATKKKTIYLESTTKALRLKNIQAIKARAEELGQNKNYREKFDSGTARAVADISILLELISPLIKVGGHIFLMKSKNYQEELGRAEHAQNELHVRLNRIETYYLNDGTERVILVFKKDHPTPKKYPRKPGLPEKKPL